MRSVIDYVVRVFAAGFVVLVLLSLPLFWAHSLCLALLDPMMPHASRLVRIEPSGLVPRELEFDPNVVSHSAAFAYISQAPLVVLGIADYFIGQEPGGHHSDVYYYFPPDEGCIYFDKRIGQIVCRGLYEKKMPDKTVSLKHVQLYAGPEGVAETADKTLGRFDCPIVHVGQLWSLTLYDKTLRCFFSVNFDERTVVKGPELDKDDPHRPVQVGQVSKNSHILSLHWKPPQIKISDSQKRRGAADLEPMVRSCDPTAGQYLLVLDECGRIDLLDRETLNFAGTAGRLPATRTFFPSKPSVTPRDLLAYEVLPLAFGTDCKYRGMFVASVSREGTATTLTVFDADGMPIGGGLTKVYTQHTEPSRTRHNSSSRAAFFHVPWGPALTVTEYLLENLHPPLLSLLSYFAADSFEAAAGHRALFILPNSFVAMKARDATENAATKLSFALLLMLPSIILAILLAWRVSKDSAVVGLSENTRLCWTIGTISFGLPAYITYRLTRPKETLVTCASCGKLRRPDMDRCHRCGSKWHVPELTPPAWRVVDVEDSPPASVEAAAE